MELFRVELAALEVGLGERFIDLDDLLLDLLVGIFDRAEHGRGAVGLLGLEDVDDVLAAGRGQVDRQAFHAESVADAFDESFEVDVVLVDLVDHDRPGQVALLGDVEDPAGDGLDALARVDDDHRGLDRGQARDRVPDEVAKPRRVEQVDDDGVARHVALGLEVDHRLVQRVLVVVLFLGPIADGVLVLDAAHTLGDAR